MAHQTGQADREERVGGEVAGAAATRNPVRAAAAAVAWVGAPHPAGNSRTPAPSSTVRRIAARAPGRTRNAS
ncbi:hypothetical protein ABZZ16_42705, partial [Streptomyces sp. NPDC006386]|uniref:hypothetical protein n=1 Tax=Streptomyces sp. NPDC006386 TaxID=3156762 RepID=UPI0033B22971